MHHTINIGVLAHVDAGKTSLTERLLFDAGVIDRLGSVDAGDTQTDTGAIERERGITVRSAVASFRAGNTQVNLIDTPGHSDFIAEVERALGVLDGAVLVLSAVEGAQAAARVLMKALRRLRLPVLLFVNKIDRAGARHAELLTDIRRLLAPHIVPMTDVRDLGTRAARTRPRSLDDVGVRTEVAEVLAETDDALLARLVDGPLPSPAEVRAALAAGTAEGRVHPVYFGSALSGEGVAALVEGVVRYVPPSRAGDGGTEPRGTVFAVERAAGSATKTAYLRLFSGELTVRQHLTLHRPGDRHGAGHSGQITALEVVGRARARTLAAGEIARIKGLPEVRVGDRLGEFHDDEQRHFAAPTLHTLVHAREPGPAAAARLHTALLALADQDPLITARAMPGGATSVLLYGEVQKQIIAATLAQDYGIEADFEPSRPVLVERPAGVGEACHEMARRGHTGPWATVGLRVEPAATGSGVGFGYETELGALPRAFHTAIEQTVHDTLRQGPRGRAVTDCRVTLIRSGFNAPVSTAADFRGVTPGVLWQALERAGWRVYEPYHAFELEIPSDVLAPVTARLAAVGADLAESAGGGAGWLLTGEIPVRSVHAFEHALPGLSRGEGVWLSRPSGDRPLPGSATVR
ncbi:tetracycline resistance protein TetP [Streptomyces himastatinicus ATCC 53653]|uniref:Tetracycline resistance protein TetP n=1 Tax=Streptomyces himastatinicus ATCC 53653 TaxID=457427 RepID=D9WNH7_9ACTN|nr:tetracycline resistance ribosomal protection protein Otr(A) [Streptomyces himastatinicus]EFL23874.1 tetracycline resistance protein TetP [Streptomyces himastatinicus ATCC 53653]